MIRDIFFNNFRKSRQIQGVTMIEAVVTIAVVGVLAAITAPNILAVNNNPLKDSTNRLSSQLRLVRAKAMAQTSAYRIRWTMLNQTDADNVQTQLIIERGNSCNSTNWARDAYFSEEDRTSNKKIELYQLLVNGVAPPSVIDPTPATPGSNWTICINSRGIADKNVQWALRWRQGGSGPTQRFEIFPGGALQVYDN